MTSGAVPLARNRLRVERDLHAVVLGDTVEKESRQPQLIAHLDSLARANLNHQIGPGLVHKLQYLVLPLGGHHLGVGAGNLESGIEARLVVRLDNVTTDHLARANTTVVRSLDIRVSV